MKVGTTYSRNETCKRTHYQVAPKNW